MWTGYRISLFILAVLIPMASSAQTQIGGNGSSGSGGSVNTICNPTTLSNTGQVGCIYGSPEGTVTGPTTNHGAYGLWGDPIITITSPNTTTDTFVGVFGEVDTIGTGSFTNAAGQWSFRGYNTISGSAVVANSSNYVAMGMVPIMAGGTLNNSVGFFSQDLSGQGTAFNYDFFAAPPVASGVKAVQYAAGEGVAPVGIAAVDELYADSTAHAWKMNNNNGGALAVGGIVCSGQIALTTGAILSGARATNTLACTGLATATDSIVCTFNSDTNAVTGYAPSGTGAVITLKPWVSANTINVDQVNNTSGSITPGAATVNCRGIR